MAYDPSRIEPDWQRFWEENGTFVATEDPSKPKFYALDMFPYPSGKGLHVGHPAGYTASDVVSRFKRARGFNVLHPMGYDAFGLPAEQKAIEEGVAPQVSTAEAIENFRRQLKRLGFSYDWTREISTADPAYYKWTQAIFARLHGAGLAYQADTFVNWCPALGTVLANDEVIDGKSERGGHPVVRTSMRQWMLKISDFAEDLLAGLDTVDWPEPTKVRQREWIGKSVGARITFAVAETTHHVEVFTTRPDTLFGATFLVLAPEHPLVEAITPVSHRAEVDAYRAATASKSEVDRQAAKEKTGVDTGARAINPGTGQAIPVWIADYVIYGYGTGAIMSVPGHDERDHAFATAMHLPIVEVISGGDVSKEAHTGEGALVNSGPFTGLSAAEGKAQIIAWLTSSGSGKPETTYRLRDWIFARQRYWGEPIPILKDPQTKAVVRALTEAELPVVLPEVQTYKPLGTGESPLASVTEWVQVYDETAGRLLARETDTMPGSAGSSWYFLRYTDPHNAAAFAARDKTDYWMPVDLYVGGPEHTVGHLLYARMWQRFLHQQGLVRDPEPFAKLRHQGMILGFTYYDPDKRIVPESDVEDRGEGKFVQKSTGRELVARIEKMSKRKGNVVNPDDVIQRYGTDAMRVYICFMGPLEADKPWQTNGLEGQFGWLKRAWRLYFEGDEDKVRVTDAAPGQGELKILHKTIKKVTEDIEAYAFNTAISALHVAVRDLAGLGCTSRQILAPLAQLIAPFAPHFAEEVWARGVGKAAGISYVPWPVHDEALAKDDVITMGVQVLGKTRGEILIPPDADEATAVAAARACPPVAKLLEGKTLARVIYKPGRILNLIVQ